MRQTRLLGVASLLVAAWLIAASAIVGAHPQQFAPVSVQVQVVPREAVAKSQPAPHAPDDSNVVVWLSPLADRNDAYETASIASRAPSQHANPQLVQRNKSFEPHVLVIQRGSTVEFPNKDPFFHNVFSLFDGKRFDLGLYEGGSSNSARFDRLGVSFLFCNIHPEMSAIVVVVDTPHFALTDRAGRAIVANVPDGRYAMHVWFERSTTEDLKSLDRIVNISQSSRTLDAVRVMESPDYKLAHKNKYGQEYAPQVAPAYARP